MLDLPVPAYECVVDKVDSVTHENVKERALLAMQELEGWCSPQKAATLMDLIFLTRPQTVVEVGVFGGKSLIPMAFALKALDSGVVYGIDPWSAPESMVGKMDEANREWWAKVDYNAIYNGLVSKIKKFKLQKQVQLIKASSEGAKEIENIDILHIDGNHSEETSCFDVLKWVPLVRRGGLIIFDDLDWASTQKASNMLQDYGVQFLELKEGNVWGVWIKQ